MATANALPETKPMVVPIEAVKQGFRKYAVFSGRATRAEFWLLLLLFFIGGVVFSAFDNVFPNNGASLKILERTVDWEFGPFNTMFTLATLLPTIAVTTRRLHDISKTGRWQALWWAVSLAAGLIALIMFVIALIVTNDIAWKDAGAVFSFLPFTIVLIAASVLVLAVIVWEIVWMVQRGASGQNSFGPDPRALDSGA